jgi:cytidine deaminase|tara:strand:+ start:549 stop:947 length:399 start_codon:yes stop_codon:yes gene_type:complete
MMKEDSYFPLLLEVMTRAYAPYSKFAVGAVVRSTSGALYTGANVENAAYPQGWCAETSALAAMIMAGETRLAEIAVIAAGQDICTPCGGCRQKIREFADPDARVLCYGPEGLRATYTLGELLPHAFGPDHLL